MATYTFSPGGAWDGFDLTDPNTYSPLLNWDPSDPNYPYDPNDPNSLPKKPATVQTGRIMTDAQPGEAIYQFVYDGLGRLIETRRPYDTANPGVDMIERYAYDGVRRIETVATIDDGQSATMLEPTAYVWGPDYVDEIVAQYDGEAAALTFALVDGNYNVVATTDAAGNVETQYVYTPYGELLDCDVFVTPTPKWVIGHQGLFFQPLTATWSEGYSLSDPNTPGVYHNRARTYDPKLGRFTSKDMNESAMPVATAMAFNAQSRSFLFGMFDAMMHYADGANLYQYVGSNPFNRRDPMGLDEVDDLIASMNGERAAALAAISGHVGRAFNAAKFIGYTALTMLPGAGVVELAIKLSRGDEVDIWDIVGASLDVAGPVGKIAGKFVGAISAYKLSSRAAKNVVNSSGDIVRKLPCNCFVAGTPVDTPDGATPIEQLEPDDEVMTRPEDDPTAASRPGRVSRVFRDVAPMVLWLTLSNGTVLGTTPGHEVWTHEDGWGSAAALEVGDALSGLDGGIVTIEAIALDRTPTEIYNIEVDGTFTYFVDGVWVHNNSCPSFSHLLGKIKPYKEAKKLTKGFKSEIQAHHILEARHLKHWKQDDLIQEVPAIVLTRAEHQALTNALSAKLPYGQGHTPEAVAAAYREIYKSYPDALQAIEKYLP